MLNRVLDSSQLIEVSDGIFSVLDEDQRKSDYDKKVGAYDAVVGNRFYNKIIWGNWPSNYHDFCKRAINLSANGTLLDAGCGSLVFTAQAYAETNNNLVVLLDRSLEMLERGKQRLTEICGSVPSHIKFVQGDIFRLPFHSASFDSVISNGLIHMFDEKEQIIMEMERVKVPAGSLFFSSLVANNRIGKAYLSALKKSGEVATVHSSESLRNRLQNMPYQYDLASIGNMAYIQSVGI